MEEKNNLNQEIAALVTQRDALLKELETYKNQIQIATEGKPAIKEQMTNSLAEIEQITRAMSKNVELINTMQREVLQPKEGFRQSQLESINEAYSTVMSDREKSEADRKAIEALKLELLGDEGRNIYGQKHRFDSLESELSDKNKNWEQNFNALFIKIEGLLPGATASGLAKAYQDQRISYNKPYWLWATVFVITMCGTLTFAIINLHDATSVEDATMKVISRLPFFIPAFWLAIFASKQQSQNKRLQQEYAYKEALTKSYEADKREIEKLPDGAEKNKLSAKLLEAMIDAAKYNPSETLGSKTHNDAPPSLFELFKIRTFKKLTGGSESAK